MGSLLYGINGELVWTDSISQKAADIMPRLAETAYEQMAGYYYSVENGIGIWCYSVLNPEDRQGYVSAVCSEISNQDIPSKMISTMQFLSPEEYLQGSPQGTLQLHSERRLSKPTVRRLMPLLFQSMTNGKTLWLTLPGESGSGADYVRNGLGICRQLLSVMPAVYQRGLSYLCGAIPGNMFVYLAVLPEGIAPNDGMLFADCTETEKAADELTPLMEYYVNVCCGAQPEPELDQYFSAVRPKLERVDRLKMEPFELVYSLYKNAQPERFQNNPEPFLENWRAICKRSSEFDRGRLQKCFPEEVKAYFAKKIAERKAAEEEAKLEAAREAARIAAELEKERIAAEVERFRKQALEKAAAQEAKRKAEEEARIAAEHKAEEAARIAAEQEKKRIAAEVERIKKLALDLSKRKADEEARISLEQEAKRIRQEAEEYARKLRANIPKQVTEETERERLRAEIHKLQIVRDKLQAEVHMLEEKRANLKAEISRLSIEKEDSNNKNETYHQSNETESEKKGILYWGKPAERAQQMINESTHSPIKRITMLRILNELCPILEKENRAQLPLKGIFNYNDSRLNPDPGKHYYPQYGIRLALRENPFGSQDSVVFHGSKLTWRCIYDLFSEEDKKNTYTSYSMARYYSIAYYLNLGLLPKGYCKKPLFMLDETDNITLTVTKKESGSLTCEEYVCSVEDTLFCYLLVLLSFSYEQAKASIIEYESQGWFNKSTIRSFFNDAKKGKNRQYMLWHFVALLCGFMLQLYIRYGDMSSGAEKQIREYERKTITDDGWYSETEKKMLAFVNQWIGSIGEINEYGRTEAADMLKLIGLKTGEY